MNIKSVTKKSFLPFLFLVYTLQTYIYYLNKGVYLQHPANSTLPKDQKYSAKLYP